MKTKDVKRTEEKEGDEVIHRGISQRSFARSFTIADDVKVNGAELKDGLLTISCEKIVPELKKKDLLKLNKLPYLRSKSPQVSNIIKKILC